MTIEYLDNGVTYEVQVTVFDTHSETSIDPKSATPRAE